MGSDEVLSQRSRRFEARLPSSAIVRSVKVDLGDEQYFVNPAGSVWVSKFDRSSFHVLGDATATSQGNYQVARARVGARTLLLVLPLERPTSPEERSRIATLIAEHIGEEAVAFVTELAEGRASLDVAANLASEAAAAIAVLRATWAWDESPDFEIQVNGGRYAVVAALQHGAWHAQVS